MTETCRRHVADTTQNVAVWAKKRHADIRHMELRRPSGFDTLGEDSEPPSIAAIEKKGDIYIKVYKLGQEGRLSNTMFSDQTGEFPFISSRGNNFIMLVHHVDSNSTWVEPLKKQLEGTLIVARTKILEQMRLQGIVPKHQILDNQCSARMKLAMDTTVLLDGSISKMTYELVPPDEHQRNIAEKAIQTFKDHFIGVLSGCATCLCTCGVSYCRRWSDNCCYYNNQG